MYLPTPSKKLLKDLLDRIEDFLQIEFDQKNLILLSWMFIHHMGAITQEHEYHDLNQSWFDEWRFAKIFARTYTDFLKVDEKNAWKNVSLLRMLIGEPKLDSEIQLASPHQMLQERLNSSEIQSYIGVNRYQDHLWYHKESLEDYLDWFSVINLIGILSDVHKSVSEKIEILHQIQEFISQVKHASDESGYKLDQFLQGLIS